MGTFSLKAPLKTLLPKLSSYREALIGAELNILPRFILDFSGFRRQKIVAKLTAVSLLVVFLLGYQPTLAFPPIKKAVVKAADEQSQIVAAKVIPQFTLPSEGYISNRFSWYHQGLDIATGFGTPIHPIAPGVVTEVNFGNIGYGNHVYLTHDDGYQSLYAHMDKIYVQKDQIIEVSNEIGTVGLTGFTSGSHTHLEISKDGKNINPETVLPPIGDTPMEQFITPYAGTQINATAVTPGPMIQAQPSIPQEAPVQEKLAKTLKIDL